jgi:hypothetical protein
VICKGRIASWLANWLCVVSFRGAASTTLVVNSALCLRRFVEFPAIFMAVVC